MERRRQRPHQSMTGRSGYGRRWMAIFTKHSRPRERRQPEMGFDKVEQIAEVHTTVDGTLYEPLVLLSERTRLDSERIVWGHSPPTLL